LKTTVERDNLGRLDSMDKNYTLCVGIFQTDASRTLNIW